MNAAASSRTLARRLELERELQVRLLVARERDRIVAGVARRAVAGLAAADRASSPSRLR